jgi:hypothetical protein
MALVNNEIVFCEQEYLDGKGGPFMSDLGSFMSIPNLFIHELG